MSKFSRSLPDKSVYMVSVIAPKKYQEAWVQGIFWLGFFLFEWLNTGAYLDDFSRSLFTIVLNIPLLIVAGYWHLLVTFRRFLLRGNRSACWLSLIGGLLVFGLLRRAISYYGLYPAYFPEGLLKPYWYWPKILAETMQLHLTVALFLAADLVRHALYQQRHKRRGNPHWTLL